MDGEWQDKQGHESDLTNSSVYYSCSSKIQAQDEADKKARKTANPADDEEGGADASSQQKKRKTIVEDSDDE